MSSYEIWKSKYPLHALAQLGDLTAIQARSESMLPLINSPDNEHWQPIHYASFEGCALVIAWLLDNGANITSSNHFGSTPLHLAIGTGNIAATQMLLKYITSLEQLQCKNEDKQTPRQMIVLNDLRDVQVAIRTLLDEKEAELKETKEKT
jgi:ankyrin repeat protein